MAVSQVFEVGDRYGFNIFIHGLSSPFSLTDASVDKVRGTHELLVKAWKASMAEEYLRAGKGRRNFPAVNRTESGRMIGSKRQVGRNGPER